MITRVLRSFTGPPAVRFFSPLCVTLVVMGMGASSDSGAACLPEPAPPGAFAPWVGMTLAGRACEGGLQGFGPYDYLTRASAHCALNIVETHHFTPKVEKIISGEHSATPDSDLDYTLRAWPNHHRALNSRVRLGIRQARDKKTIDLRYPPAECYLNRAISFSPSDAVPYMLFGIYLHKLDKMEEALAKYQEAEKLAPSNMQMKYNVGLLYFDMGDFERAAEYATEVYSSGFPLPGLKRKLQESGHWEKVQLTAVE